MTSSWTKSAVLLVTCGSLVGCGGGTREEPINTDYSALRLAQSHEGALSYATSDEQLLRAVRNGLRLSLVGTPEVAAVSGLTAPRANDPQEIYSSTTIQVDGVDEADLVKYDGSYLYTMSPRNVPDSPGYTRNILTVARTNPATAGTTVLSEFRVSGEQTGLPQLYQLQSEQGSAEFLAAISQDYGGWLGGPAVDFLVLQPDRTRIQLIDVRDPINVSLAWEMQLDGWLRASRKIGDVIYLVNSYRPRLPGFQMPNDSQERKHANELRVRNASAADLLPGYRVNGGSKQQLLEPGDCVLAADLGANDAFADLVVITAVDLTQRRVTDVNCVSTNVNGVYVSLDSLYVGGENAASIPGAGRTVLHKFALKDGDIGYRATGVVSGLIGWQNASYFLDEYQSHLRILTSEFSELSGDFTHRLHVLREGPGKALELVATLPNAQRTARIGKPGEQVHAVRFFGDRAYVVTARIVDPLYVLELSEPADPIIAGQLEIPGVSTFLQPLGAAGAEVVLAIGGQTDGTGIRDGVKVELFDVRDIRRPRSIGSRIFGRRNSSSEATSDPHALTLHSPAPDRVRVGLPIDVFATPRQDIAGTFDWTYSGSHLFEITGLSGGTPQLEFKGVIKTAESDGTNPFPVPPHTVPRRAVMHDDAVFVIDGERFLGELWSGVAF